MGRIGRARGMTLVELMIVVVIIGILSVLAATGYRKYVLSARNAEATNMLQAIRASQEAYYQSYNQYCGSLEEKLWPAAIPQQDKLEWGRPGPVEWRQLGVKTPGWVWFQYGIRAGTAGQGDPAFGNNQPQRPWFVARARGDFILGGETSMHEITSETSTVYVERENQ